MESLIWSGFLASCCIFPAKLDLQGKSPENWKNLVMVSSAFSIPKQIVEPENQIMNGV